MHLHVAVAVSVVPSFVGIRYPKESLNQQRSTSEPQLFVSWTAAYGVWLWANGNDVEESPQEWKVESPINEALQVIEP